MNLNKQQVFADCSFKNTLPDFCFSYLIQYSVVFSGGFELVRPSKHFLISEVRKNDELLIVAIFYPISRSYISDTSEGINMCLQTKSPSSQTSGSKGRKLDLSTN